MKMNALILTLTFLLSVPAIAQNNSEAPKIKFDKVSEEELKMKSYPNDTTAEAVILYDNGESYIKFDADNVFMLNYERFVRIKILKQSGVEWGNFLISLYSSKQSREMLGTVKGTTTNLENGKIIKTELKKDAIFRERENDYRETVRLSMPSVKIGSVIDLQYKISSYLMWNLRSWNFQYSIPVKWSQYKVSYPEFYTYSQSQLGYYPLLYSKNSQTIALLNQTSYGTNTFTTDVFEYAAKDVPALRAEPYLTTLNNFTSQIKFELAFINFTKFRGEYKNYTTSWNDIAKQLVGDDNYGLHPKGDNFTEDVVAELIKGTTDEMKKIELIYSHVQHIMKWNGYNSVYMSNNLKKTWSDKTGNSTDINLLLISMLRNAGIGAYPVILSTRQNGIISPTHASISDCNYVIARAFVNGKPILLDATEPSLQVGFIPFRCLNGEGHLITSEGSEPVQLTNPRSNENTMVQLELKNGQLTGLIQKRASGLSAFDLRESIKSAGSQQEYFNKLKNNSPEIDYLEYKYDKLDSVNQPVQVIYKIAMKQGQEGDAEIIYIDPIIFERQKDNPFTLPERVYPVDFGVPFSKMYNFQLTVPEGYKIDEIPESKSFAIPDNGGQFLYQITQIGNKIVLNLRFSIDKSLFIPSEYKALKAFYDLIVHKQAEQIVLKKTAV